MAAPHQTLVQHGFEQLEAGQWEEAIETFSAALVMSPHESRAHRGRGLASLQLRQWPAAAAAFECAKRSDPHDPDNWVDLGISLASDGKIYQALKVFEELLAREPSYVRGYMEFGVLYLRLGAIPKGRELLQQALTHHPTPTQRQMIESMIREQQRLDRKRFYRPDFEALYRARVAARPGLIQAILKAVKLK